MILKMGIKEKLELEEYDENDDGAMEDIDENGEFLFENDEEEF